MKTAEKIKPCAKWTPDCQGKWDYDGRLISISTRFWPAGGGFHYMDANTREFVLSTDPEIRPSATASIVLNYGEPDERGYGQYRDLTKQEFEGETEAEVKAQVEAWVQEKFKKVIAALENNL
jgi:hypothetical protein